MPTTTTPQEATMFTADTLARLVAYAGADYSWRGAPATSARPVGTVAKPLRQGLTLFLWQHAQGICAGCGTDALKDGQQVAHVVSRGAGHNGYMPGNLFSSCYGCNELDRTRGAVVALSTIVRPDLIPTTWPSREELLALGRAAVAYKREHGVYPWGEDRKPAGEAMTVAVARSIVARG